MNSARTTFLGFAAAMVALATLIYSALLTLLSAGSGLSGTLRSIALLAAAVVVPVLIVYSRRSGGWFHPLAFPAAYLAVVLITPATFVLATSASLAQLSPQVVTSRLVLILGLLFLGYVVGTTAALTLTPTPPKGRWHIDYLRLRRFGRVVLAVAGVAEFLELLLTSGAAYGEAQVVFGPRAQLASIVKIAVIVAMSSIVTSNIALLRRAMCRYDWLLFGSLTFLVLSSGSRGDTVPGLILVVWGWLSQHKVPWTRILVMSALVALAFAGIIGARQHGSLIPTSGQQTLQALLISLSSPSYLTANVAHVVPGMHPYENGSTYVQDLYWQLPGFFSRTLFGAPHTGAYVYRDLVGFHNPNQGFGFSMPAEAYLNFGPWGVPIVGLAVGLLFGWAWRRSNDAPTRAQHVLYLVLIATFPSAIRSDALGSLKLVLYPMIILFFAFRSCRTDELGAPRRGFARLRRVPRQRGGGLADPPRVAVAAGQLASTAARRMAPDRGAISHDRPRPARLNSPELTALLFTSASAAQHPAPRPAALDAQAQRRRWQRVGSRAAAALVDQAFSSLTNFVVAFAALRWLNVVGLGEFTLAYFTSQLVLTFVRSLVLEPLTIRFTEAHPDARRRATAAAAGASLIIGTGLLVIALLASVVLRGDARAAVVATGVILPVLLVQDAWRFHLFAAGRTWAAAANDAVCLLGTAAATIVLAASVHRSAAVFLVAWGVGASAGLIFGIVQIRAIPRPRAGLTWLHDHRDLGPHLAVGGGIEFAASQLALVVIGALGGLAATGLIGSGRTLITPATTLVAGVYLFAVPEARRVLRGGNRSLAWFCAGVSLLLAFGIAAYAGFLALVPDQWGNDVVGHNWKLAKSILLPIAIWVAAAGVRGGAAVGLRALERGRLIAGLSACTALLILVGVSIGVVLNGGVGATWGFAIVYIVAALAWWTCYLRARARTASSNAALVPSA